MTTQVALGRTYQPRAVVPALDATANVPTRATAIEAVPSEPPSIAYVSASLLAMALGLATLGALVMVTFPIVVLGGVGWLVAGPRWAQLVRRVQATSDAMARGLRSRTDRTPSTRSRGPLIGTASANR